MYNLPAVVLVKPPWALKFGVKLFDSLKILASKDRVILPKYPTHYITLIYLIHPIAQEE
jgi:hypothetical protein